MMVKKNHGHVATAARAHFHFDKILNVFLQLVLLTARRDQGGFFSGAAKEKWMPWYFLVEKKVAGK